MDRAAVIRRNRPMTKVEVLLADTLDTKVVVVIDSGSVLAGSWLTAEELDRAADVILEGDRHE